MIGILINYLLFRAFAGSIELHVPTGSSVNFDLPDFRYCPNMMLSDPEDILILKVTNGSPTIMSFMTIRAEMNITHGQMAFTLKDIQSHDEGTYLLEPLDDNTAAPVNDNCGRIYELTVEREGRQASSGYWLEWDEWSSCRDSGDCGVGIRGRTRECSIPRYCFEGPSLQCVADDLCTLYVWSQWSYWSGCSVTCGTGSSRRERQCHNTTWPGGSLGQCHGQTEETSQCSMDSCIPDASWSGWSMWTVCTASCGPASRQRRRFCRTATSTSAGTDVDTCVGEPIEEEQCRLETCRNVVASWSVWSTWTSCSASCGPGSRRRQRVCSMAIGEETDTAACSGVPIEEEQCKLGTCSNGVETNSLSFEWKTWTEWTTCSTSCDTGWKSRDRKCTDQYNREVHVEYCSGQSKDNLTCSESACKDSVPKDASESTGNDPTVALPLSVIVGAGAGVFILILVVVIVILVIIIKRRSKRTVRTTQDRDSKSASKKKAKKSRHFKRKPEPARPMSRMSSHVYAEINDDDVYVRTEKKLSVVTIDNTYAPLPRSGSGSTRDCYENTFNFDPESVGSKTYANAEQDTLAVGSRTTRQDSAGYLVPMTELNKTKVRYYRN